MNVGNIAGAVGLAGQHPQLIRPFADHLRHRFSHPFTKHKNGRVHAPEQITIVVTDICNLRCKMCQYAYSDSPGYQLNQAGHMSSDLFYKILDEITGHPLVTFTGGEPLLHKQIVDFIAATKRRGLITSLTTNGWLLAQKAEALSQAGLDILVVSVDGPEATHNMIRGGNAYVRLAEGIRVVQQQEKRPILMVNMTISNLNYKLLTAMYDQAKAWGVDGMNFNHLWMQTDEMLASQKQQFPDFDAGGVAWEVDPEAIDVEVLADQLEAVRQRNRLETMLVTELPQLNRAQIRVWYRQTALFVKYQSTRCAWTRMKIWPDGRIKPCREWVAGNVAVQSLEDIWQGQGFQGFRSLLAEHGTIPLCSRCCYMTHR